MVYKKKTKNAKAISDRSGFEHPYNEMVVEKGTNLLVHYTEDDGKWNAVTHPLNYPAKPKEESQGLAFARPDIFDED